jgi:WD40 repeat protein
MRRDKTTVEGLKDSVDSLALLPDGTILSAQYSVLNLWNLVNGKCIGTIKENEVIRSVILLPEWKIAISSSSRIKVRLAKGNYQCIRNVKLEGCIDYFTLLLLKNGNLLCSVRKDLSINFMVLDSSNDYICIKDFQTRSKRRTQLVNLSDNKFASVSYKKSIKLWDIDNDYKLLKKLDGHTSFVTATLFIAKWVFCIWNLYF